MRRVVQPLQKRPRSRLDLEIQQAHQATTRIEQIRHTQAPQQPMTTNTATTTQPMTTNTATTTQPMTTNTATTSQQSRLTNTNQLPQFMRLDTQSMNYEVVNEDLRNILMQCKPWIASRFDQTALDFAEIRMFQSILNLDLSGFRDAMRTALSYYLRQNTEYLADVPKRTIFEEQILNYIRGHRAGWDNLYRIERNATNYPEAERNIRVVAAANYRKALNERITKRRVRILTTMQLKQTNQPITLQPNAPTSLTARQPNAPTAIRPDDEPIQKKAKN